MIVVPAWFIGDIGLISCFVFCFLPLELEVRLGDLSGLNELHIIDIDGFSDEVRLLKARLIIVVDEAVDRSKLRVIESKMSSQENSL